LGDSTHIEIGQLLIVDINLAPSTVSPYRPLIIRGYEDVTYPHPFGDEMDNVTFRFGDDSDGWTIVIDFSETVRDLQFVPVEFDGMNYNFLTLNAFDQAPIVEDNQYLMIHNWLDTGGTLSNQGFVFTDSEENVRQFLFGIDNKNGRLGFVEVVDGVIVTQQ